MPRSVRSRAPLAAFVVLAMAVAACSDNAESSPQAAPSPTLEAPSPSAAPSPSPTVDGPPAPLTGAPVDEDVLERPVVAVKIENSPAARPQSGLDAADVVYEELVEGGVTRFIAVYHSQVPDQVGPVRSGRLVDAEVLPAHGALLALSGARDQVVSKIAQAGIATVYDDGHGATFYRESSRKAPHNLYARGETLFTRADERDGLEPPEAMWTYTEKPPACGEDCSTDGDEIRIPMSTSSVTGWEYDTAAGVYRRSQNGQPFAVTGPGRIGAANVVVLGMRIGPGECCDTSGARLVATQPLGSGRAIVLRDGRWYEVIWSKAAPGDPFVLIAADGEALPLKPGPTWFHLAPSERLPAMPSS